MERKDIFTPFTAGSHSHFAAQQQAANDAILSATAGFAALVSAVYQKPPASPFKAMVESMSFLKAEPLRLGFGIAAEMRAAKIGSKALLSPAPACFGVSQLVNYKPSPWPRTLIEAMEPLHREVLYPKGFFIQENVDR
ncbi:hypothetical protein GCM10027299_28980 [Larkinella ripae]